MEVKCTTLEIVGTIVLMSVWFYAGYVVGQTMATPVKHVTTSVQYAIRQAEKEADDWKAKCQTLQEANNWLRTQNEAMKARRAK